MAAPSLAAVPPLCTPPFAFPISQPYLRSPLHLVAAPPLAAERRRHGQAGMLLVLVLDLLLLLLLLQLILLLLRRRRRRPSPQPQGGGCEPMPHATPRPSLRHTPSPAHPVRPLLLRCLTCCGKRPAPASSRPVHRISAGRRPEARTSIRRPGPPARGAGGCAGGGHAAAGAWMMGGWMVES